MRRKNFTNQLVTIVKEKAFLILLLVSILAVAGIAAVNMLQQEENQNNNLYVDLEENTTAPETTNLAALEETESQTEAQVAMDETADIGDAMLAEGETTAFFDETNLMDATDEPITETEVPEETHAVGGPAIQLSFGDTSSMKWPVQGNVILEFSMDSTVYFSTLQQYKYHPAILIQGEVNTPVLAAANGIVTEISSNEEIGDYVVMALGNEYQIVYGQLKALEVGMGDMVEEGQIIGYIGEPTKYYVVEGSNLYLQLLNGSTPVDPLDYIE